nr:MAG TPA: hypothetical protein [Caudoviricetes sp.]
MCGNDWFLIDVESDEHFGFLGFPNSIYWNVIYWIHLPIYDGIHH